MERILARQEDGSPGAKGLDQPQWRQVFDHALQVGTAVGKTILTQLVKGHLGLPA
jgi:hypothetical protein